MTAEHVEPTTNREPREVSRFEADLLRVLRFCFGRVPGEQALPIIGTKQKRPKCLSRTAVELIQDTLAQGCVWRLAQQGGWQRERHLRGERIAEGRLWDRSPPDNLGLTFSGHTLEFLITITAESPGETLGNRKPSAGEPTVGDRLLTFFAFEALRPTGFLLAVRPWPEFSRHGLCWLTFPEDFVDVSTRTAPDLAPWLSEAGAWVLEALQSQLAGRWVQIERSKETITDWKAMQALGRAQERVLSPFLTALDSTGRRDLARFLLRAVSDLLRSGLPARAWVGGLDLKGLRMTDRSDTYRAALTLLHQFDRLHHWEADARTIGYLDDGYSAAQLWKSDWDRLDGESLWNRSQAILRELGPLRT